MEDLSIQLIPHSLMAHEALGNVVAAPDCAGRTDVRPHNGTLYIYASQWHLINTIYILYMYIIHVYIIHVFYDIIDIYIY
jgi:hypothetical protein